MVEQNHAKFELHNRSGIDYGLHSASLDKRDTTNQVIFAGIQSIYKRQDMGVFDLIIIDEAHSLPKSGDGMYRTFIEHQQSLNKKVRVVGLTATDYRLSSGRLTEGEGRLFTDVAAEVKISELLSLGYLTPIRYLRTNHVREMTGVQTTSGEYNLKQSAIKMMENSGTKQCLSDAMRTAEIHNTKKWKIYCTTLEHCDDVKLYLDSKGVSCEIYSSKTSKEDRKDILARYSTDRLQALISCDALTTGFDEVKIDHLINLKPTKSMGRWVQILGRGMRIFGKGTDKEKKYCILSDYTTNTLSHGRADREDISTDTLFSCQESHVQYCNKCNMANHIYTHECEVCGTKASVNRYVENIEKSLRAINPLLCEHINIYSITHLTLKRASYQGRQVAQLNLFGVNGASLSQRPAYILSEFLDYNRDSYSDPFIQMFTHFSDIPTHDSIEQYCSHLITHKQLPVAVITLKNAKGFNYSLGYAAEGKKLHWERENKEIVDLLRGVTHTKIPERIRA